MRAKLVWVPLCALVLGLVGCEYRGVAPLEPRVSRAIDARVTGEGVADVDLLLVIDDSRSMEDEQDNLAAQIPALVSGLTNPPRDTAGRPLWNAARSLHVGVVTSDMGTSGASVSIPTCGVDGVAGAPWGWDGALRDDGACGGAGDAVLAWAEGEDPDAFAARVGCVARAGIAGCGFEQPLAAGARALARGAAGFPREDALLAVIVLSDEEDCSLADTDGFFGSLAGQNINTHCVFAPGYLEPVASLVQGLRSGRGADRFVFGAITGIPLDLSGASPAEILAHPDMGYVADATSATGLRAACKSPQGDASPGRRLVEAASLLEGSLLWSICDDDFSPAVAELTRRIGARIQGVCLDRELRPDAQGHVDCVVRETLPAGMRCDGLPARTLFELADDGREVCEVAQLAPGITSGWYYDVDDADCERVAYTPDAVPPFGVDLRLQCLVEVEAPSGGALGAP